MLAGALDTCQLLHHLRRLETPGRRDLHDLRSALCQRAGLVDDERVDPFHPLEHLRVAKLVSETDLIRHGLATIVRGKKSLPLAVQSMPVDPQMREQLLNAWLDTKLPAPPKAARRCKRRVFPSITLASTATTRASNRSWSPSLTGRNDIARIFRGTSSTGMSRGSAESLHSRSSLDLCDEECLAHRIDVGLNAAAHAGVGDRRGAVSVAHDDDDRAHATGAGQSTRCAALAIA